MGTHPKKQQQKEIVRERRVTGIKEATGSVLRARRATAALSQTTVSLAAELERNHISRIERGLQSPTIETFVAVAHALGVPAWQVLKEAEEMVFPPKAPRGM